MLRKAVGVTLIGALMWAQPVAGSDEKGKVEFYPCALDFTKDGCPAPEEKKAAPKEEPRPEAAPTPKVTPESRVEAPSPEKKDEDIPSVMLPPGTLSDLKAAYQAAVRGDFAEARKWATYPLIVQPGSPPAMVGMAAAVARGDIEGARKWADEWIAWQQEAMLKVGLIGDLGQQAAVARGYSVASVQSSEVQVANGSGGPGGAVSLPRFVGRPTLFYFYLPTCPYCRKTTPELIRFVRENPEVVSEMEIVTVVPSAEMAASSSDMPFRIEVSAQMFEAVQVSQTPTFLFSDPVTGMAHRWSGQTGAEEFQYWVKRVLEERKKPRRAQPWQRKYGVEEKVLPIGLGAGSPGIVPSSIAQGVKP